MHDGVPYSQGDGESAEIGTQEPVSVRSTETTGNMHSHSKRPFLRETSVIPFKCPVASDRRCHNRDFPGVARPEVLLILNRGILQGQEAGQEKEEGEEIPAATDGCAECAPRPAGVQAPKSERIQGPAPRSGLGRRAGNGGRLTSRSCKRNYR